MTRPAEPGFTPVQRVDGTGAHRRPAREGADGAGPGPDPRSEQARRRGAVDIRARTAWVAGGTGLVGRSVLPLLLASQRYSAVHAFVRSQASTLPPSIKLHRHRVDFEALASTPAMPHAAADDVFILLGTTIRDAGSEAGFRRIDYDAVLAIARAARVAGATRIAVVSAVGADKSSKVFYNRVKGEMEQAIASLGFRTVVIARPSLLMGDRRALGQPPRPGEDWALRLLGPIRRFVPIRWRPIPARTVARALVRAMIEAQPGVRVLQSSTLHTLGA